MTPDRSEVFGGVDTHKEVHAAAAVDAAGRLLGKAAYAADAGGYEQPVGWLRGWGCVRRVGVEGTGRSPRRSMISTPSCSRCASRPTRRCWALSAPAPRSPQRC